MWAYKPLRTKYFHGASSGNQPPYLLKPRYGKVSLFQQGTHLRRDTVIPQWFQASKAAAASDGHAVHCWVTAVICQLIII